MACHAAVRHEIAGFRPCSDYCRWPRMRRKLRHGVSYSLSAGPIPDRASRRSVIKLWMSAMFSV